MDNCRIRIRRTQIFPTLQTNFLLSVLSDYNGFEIRTKIPSKIPKTKTLKNESIKLNHHKRQSSQNTQTHTHIRETKKKLLSVLELFARLLMREEKNLRPCSFFRAVDKWRKHHRIVWMSMILLCLAYYSPSRLALLHSPTNQPTRRSSGSSSSESSESSIGAAGYQFSYLGVGRRASNAIVFDWWWFLFFWILARSWRYGDMVIVWWWWWLWWWLWRKIR